MRTRRYPLMIVQPGWVVAVVLSLSVGCGQSPGECQVVGVVTYLGEPVTQGTINFRAPDGQLYGGALRNDGSFAYALPASEYMVRIDAPAPLPEDWKEGELLPANARRLAPLKYASFRSSGLSAKVDADKSSQTINFSLK